MAKGDEKGPPAGWYPHPKMAGTNRYWDGRAWTDHIAPQSAPGDSGGMVMAGWICAFLLPPVGFLIGVMLPKERFGHGVGIIVVSLLWMIMTVIGYLLIYTAHSFG